MVQALAGNESLFCGAGTCHLKVFRDGFLQGYENSSRIGYGSGTRAPLAAGCRHLPVSVYIKLNGFGDQQAIQNAGAGAANMS